MCFEETDQQQNFVFDLSFLFSHNNNSTHQGSYYKSNNINQTHVFAGDLKKPSLSLSLNSLLLRL